MHMRGLVNRDMADKYDHKGIEKKWQDAWAASNLYKTSDDPAKPKTYVLFSDSDQTHPARYRQNAGLDFNEDGKVTKAEAAARVNKMLVDGLKPGNSAV